MTQLIISYKAHDQASVAATLFTQLSSILTEYDVTGVSSLANSAIVSEVNSARALLIIIGRNWADGEWLQDSADDDTIAIQAALQNKEVSTVPILVDGAQFPENLPFEFADLKNRPSFKLSSFNISTTAQEIATALQAVQTKPPTSAPSPAPSGFSAPAYGGAPQTAYQQPFQSAFQTPQPPSSVVPVQSQQGYYPAQQNYVQQSSGTDPNLVMVVEILAGFFGFLGIGHMLAGEIGMGLMLLIGWWVYNFIAFIFIALTVGLGACIIIPINIGAIIFSGIMARNTAQRKQGIMS